MPRAGYHSHFFSVVGGKQVSEPAGPPLYIARFPGVRGHTTVSIAIFLQARSHIRFPRGAGWGDGGGGDSYPSVQKYHCVANFPVDRFQGVWGKWGKFAYIVVFPTTWNRLNFFQTMFVG